MIGPNQAPSAVSAELAEPSPFITYPSRRSTLHSPNGIVACTQPLAASAGIRILQQGGNAADAAIATAAVIALTEPASTGAGGDLFCLWYQPNKPIQALNASGRSPKALTLEHALATLPQPVGSRIPMSHPHAVTVPGAPAGWCDIVEHFGSGQLSLKEILAPAIEYAEGGFPVHIISARVWGEGEKTLRDAGGAYNDLLLKDGDDYRAPREGEMIKLPVYAKTLRELAEKGKKGFYEGRIAEAIVEAIQSRGGVMTLEDFKEHGEKGSEISSPVGVEVPWGNPDGTAVKRMWECAPNGQGLVALQALRTLHLMEEEKLISSLKELGHNTPEYLHALLTALRLAFADGHHHISDPSSNKPTPIDALLSDEYLRERARVFKANSVPPLTYGRPDERHKTDTVYLCVSDKDGNSISFINSTYAAFGSGIVPTGCGFALQNRGTGFLLKPGNHPNVLAPGKRPYHTIIPGMLTQGGDGKEDHGELYASLGVMGGYMQPQGHVQVLLNLLLWNMSPQTALDAPRFLLGGNYSPVGGRSGEIVFLEEGMSEESVNGLRRLGYDVTVVTGDHRGAFGRGQVIRRGRGGGWEAGGDMRGDGGVVGY